MKHITTQDALRALEEAVAEKGEDYVYGRIDIGSGYRTCYYVVAGQPSCIAAHALHRLGVPLQGLAAHEGTTPSGLAERDVFSADEEALKALDHAQSEQDHGKPWGEALEAARGVLR